MKFCGLLRERSLPRFPSHPLIRWGFSVPLLVPSLTVKPP
jgi:hypothetical protein